MAAPSTQIRHRKERQVFDPSPVPSSHVSLAIQLGFADTPSEVTVEQGRLAAEEEAARRAAARVAQQEQREIEAMLEAATPRPLPFALPPRERAESAPPMMLLQGPQELPGTSDADAHLILRKDAKRWHVEEGGLRPIHSSQTVDLCSEFTGIGGFEHGLCAGFAEADGVHLRLIEASELDDTTIGVHATAVLHKRFPECQVLGPGSRLRMPYPSSVDMLTVTPICTQHSGLNVDGNPDETEDTLDRVFARIAMAPSLEVIAFENVPNFLSVLDGQFRSSYSHWISELTDRGFVEHAFVVMPTIAAGDLHARSRILSLHTKGAFHPVAALLRLISKTRPTPGAALTTHPRPPLAGSSNAVNASIPFTGGATGSTGRKASACNSLVVRSPAQAEVFCFTTGLGETRYASRNRGVDAVWGRLPAYNRGLNVGLFFRGSLYTLSPWLAARASGLPEGYQDVHKSTGAETRVGSTVAGAGLANMVSPLQARELGHAVASEWQAPRTFAQLALEGAPGLPDSFGRNVPTEFPRAASLTQPATLCYNHPATGRWHQVMEHWWPQTEPAATLAELCDEALAKGELPPLRSLVDLQRVADDTSLDAYPRRCAVVQYARMQAEAEQQKRARDDRRMEAERRRSIRQGRTWRFTVTLAALLQWMARAGLETTELHDLVVPADAWIACDLCSKWRRLRRHGRQKLPSVWTCIKNVDTAFAACSVAQELSNDEIDQLLGLVSAADEAAVSCAMVTVTLRGADLPPEPPPSCWALCDRCSKWRRLACPLATEMCRQHWYCELNADRKHNRCDAAEEHWDGLKEEVVIEPDEARRAKGREARRLKAAAQRLATALSLRGDAAIETCTATRANDGMAEVCGDATASSTGVAVAACDDLTTLPTELARCPMGIPVDLDPGGPISPQRPESVYGPPRALPTQHRPATPSLIAASTASPIAAGIVLPIATSTASPTAISTASAIAASTASPIAASTAPPIAAGIAPPIAASMAPPGRVLSATSLSEAGALFSTLTAATSCVPAASPPLAPLAFASDIYGATQPTASPLPEAWREMRERTVGSTSASLDVASVDLQAPLERERLSERETATAPSAQTATRQPPRRKQPLQRRPAPEKPPPPPSAPAPLPRLSRSEEEEHELRLAREEEKQVHGTPTELHTTHVTAILKHHVYPGALPGCLFNIYVKLAFSNGTTYARAHVHAIRTTYARAHVHAIRTRPCLTCTSMSRSDLL